MTHKNIDLDKIKEISHTGIRRAAIFLGFGINAALTENFKQYDLTEITQIQIVPPTDDENTIKNYKKEFSTWITACGLRELTETFSFFLDNINDVCLSVYGFKGKLTKSELVKLARVFAKKGIKGKLEILREKYNISTAKEAYLESINQARNCFAHRLGIVAKADCFDKDFFILKWMGLDIIAQLPNGDSVLMSNIPQKGVLFKDGGTIVVKMNERVRYFNIGQRINFTPRDLAEICHLMIIATNEIHKNIIDFLKANDIPIIIKK